MVNTKLIQDTERSKESIDRVIEGIRGVFREVYPDKDPDAFITDIDDKYGVTEILIHIQYNLAEWNAWCRKNGLTKEAILEIAQKVADKKGYVTYADFEPIIAEKRQS